MPRLTRRVARRFLSAASKCVAGRARGPTPPVLLRWAGTTLTLTAVFPEAALELAADAPAPADATFVVPAAVLAEAAGASDDPVELNPSGPSKAVASWRDGGTERSLPVGLVAPGRGHSPPPRPGGPAAVPPRFLAALHECGRTAARDEGGRFALTRVQVKGKAGRVVGTDGKAALISDGFAFPFPDDLLVPAIPTFGTPELESQSDVRVGRTGTHLVVTAGSWTVWLAVRASARYPDVSSVVPRPAPTTAVLDGADAADLLAALPGLPDAGEEHRPVTIDIGRVLRVRAGDPATPGMVRELTLSGSRVSGPPLSLAVDRRPLIRALALGCRTLRLTPDKPLVVDGEDLTLVAATLEPSLVVPPSADAVPAENPVTTGRSDAMKPTETDGHAPPRGDPADPLALAEGLRERAVLGDALARATRLVAVLRAGRKEKKVLANVLANLKQLNLDAPNGHP